MAAEPEKPIKRSCVDLSVASSGELAECNHLDTRLGAQPTFKPGFGVVEQEQGRVTKHNFLPVEAKLL